MVDLGRLKMTSCITMTSVVSFLDDGRSRRRAAGIDCARFAFSIAPTDGRARTGTIAMRRGEIRTPAFMPVGTAATVKAMKPADVRASGADIILGNTYHLMLRPGAERVARLGGLHAFMGWERPILTDSGGYQVMSLAELTKVSEEGVDLQAAISTAARHMLTPERSMEIQTLLGSDIVMAFDQLVRTTESREAQAAAMERSMRWAERSREAFDAPAMHGRLVRHPAGRARRGAAPGLGRGADRDRLRRLCGRRPGGGGGAGGDVRLPRFRAAASCPPTGRAT